jgi:Transcriptional regulatory protein, C terminal
MDAIVTVEEPSPQLPPDTTLTAVAVRLADEGIPVRAIARALHIPSSDIYDMLRDARELGHLIDLPKDDWPPGSARDARVVFAGTSLEQEEDLRIACAKVFKATPLEAAMLARMLRREQVTKEQLHCVVEQNRATQGQGATDPKIVDVLICKLRKKLRPYELSIETMWGIGYLVPPADRDRAVKTLLAGV